MAERGTAAVGAVLLGFLAGVVPAAPALAESIQERQWYLDYLHVREAHKISTGKGVVVAVIDSGVDARNPDLAGRVLAGKSYWPADPAGGGGKIDHGGHGTSVSGIIAANGRKYGALGIAPGAKILPVSVTVGKGSGGIYSGSVPPDSIRWATDHGAQVINMSYGGRITSPEERAAIQYALDHDVVLVAAAGNSASSTGVDSPAKIPGVLAVSGYDEKGRFWSGSVHGPEVALAAPSVNIITLGVMDRGASGYVLAPGGTSGAAPMVAGAAALIRSRYPELKAPDVINRLISTATDAGPKGRDDQYGFGRLDLVKALTAKVPAVTANPLGDPTPTTEPQAAEPESQADAWLRQVLTITAAALAGLLVVAGSLFLFLRRR
ncbi:type VII secretion-associated serine protease mycosin [Actinoplanes awajinensis]|uniref:type VII secretion-associated serine protease mycosin n=1 Tax=Actinoplanes awajinensis TaxID=135946 RepID=UPI0012F82147|nr:type VII secretion-associated serine protease mycosin [Actinoplanes awajinensis]